jgi:hypothetical protein
VQPIETFAQRMDDAARGAPVGAKTPAGHVVAEGAERGPERERGGVTGHEPRQHQHRMSVTAAGSREQRPGSGEGGDVQAAGSRRLGEERGS